ncbi:MAG: glycosyltransferase [Acidobacteriota bacterium]|nr:glycosyltransferase [Acidobacteriota bacterium]
MASPLISIVIPTKGRADKLGYTLRTILEQPGSNFEVIICDNFSTDNTKSLISDLSDSRIRYFRTDRRLSMCDNYELALEQVRSEYAIFIGDDDALMPGAISALEAWINQKRYDIYYWEQCFYTWGSDTELPSISYVATPRKPRELILRELVESAFRFGGARYMALPLVYHSLVAVKILTSIREASGRVFHSTNPDVFCGFAMPVFAETALDVGRCMSLRGSSEGGFYDLSDNSAAAVRNRQFVKEYGDYQIHCTLDPTLPHILNCVPDSMLIAADLFPDYYRSFRFNYEFMYAMIQRYWQFRSVVEIVKSRKRLSAMHPFSIFRFIAYVSGYRVWGIFQKLRNLRRKSSGKLAELYEKRPVDVYACANLISSQMKSDLSGSL